MLLIRENTLAGINIDVFTNDYCETVETYKCIHVEMVQYKYPLLQMNGDYTGNFNK